jgi:hypothetical protein
MSWAFHMAASIMEQQHEVEMSEWQPIETAPKDGTTILAFFADRVGYVARQDVQAVAWRENDGWASTQTGWTLAWPTHWMPLPDPPKADER